MQKQNKKSLIKFLLLSLSQFTIITLYDEKEISFMRIKIEFFRCMTYIFVHDENSVAIF